MKRSSGNMALRIWSGTMLMIAVAWLAVSTFEHNPYWWLSAMAFAVTAVAAVPGFFLLWFTLPRLRDSAASTRKKICLLALICFLICLIYGFALSVVFDVPDMQGLLVGLVYIPLILFVCNMFGFWIWSKALKQYFD